VAVARAHVWWSVALLAVPAVLAGLALLWAGPRPQAAPPAAPARALPATRVAVAEPAPAGRPERITTRVLGAAGPLATVEESRRVEVTTG
jgi:hypothetical protein